MMKKILSLLLCLTILLLPETVSAAAKTKEIPLTEYQLQNDKMHISLPDGWYINTPRDIDKDFLDVSENSKRKLIKYLTDNDIDYNLVSKDLLSEINVILVNSSQTKMMYNFHLLNRDVLIDRAKALIDLGSQEDNGTITTYHSYTIDEFNDCIFMVFEGEVDTEKQKANFYQYTTMVNGYGITVTYRAYEGADYESGKKVLDKIVHTLTINEIKEADVKTNMIKQMIAPMAVVIAFVGFTIFLFVRQIRKNKKEEQEAKEKTQKN